MIGSLLYLTASRPDIMFSVCMCARYQSAPKESHLKVVKRILRYLHGTSQYGLWYSKGSDCNLVGYTDSDFSGCKSDRKNTSGTCHVFSNALASGIARNKFLLLCQPPRRNMLRPVVVVPKSCGLSNNYSILI